MPKQSYYDIATLILTTYLATPPEKRISLVRECIGSQEEEADITKIYKSIDSILIKTETLRGTLASHLAQGWCTVASETQLGLFTKDEAHRNWE
jgi:hypothetical protein